jgi:hypothetical protein
MSYAQVASNVQVCVAKKATTYVHKTINKKMTPYTGDLVCSPYRGSSRKPYCAVCFKAGKPLDVYTNHFTKSSLGPDAVVVCPTILAASCSYCKKTGHFKSVCPILEVLQSRRQSKTSIGCLGFPSRSLEIRQPMKEKEKNNQQRSLPLVQRCLPISQRVTMPSISAFSAFSAFAALDIDSDDDEVVTDIVTKDSEVTEDCDTITTNIIYIPTVMTYASVCASTQILPLCSKASIPQDFVVISPTKNINKNLAHSWADDDYWNDEE